MPITCFVETIVTAISPKTTYGFYNTDFSVFEKKYGKPMRTETNGDTIIHTYTASKTDFCGVPANRVYILCDLANRVRGIEVDCSCPNFLQGITTYNAIYCRYYSDFPTIIADPNETISGIVDTRNRDGLMRKLQGHTLKVVDKATGRDLLVLKPRGKSYLVTFTYIN